MPRIAYVNGQYARHGDAFVHVEDRGYQFADGVYEVIAVHGGALVDEQGHLDRLGRSLAELAIAWPMPPKALKVVIGEMVRRNAIRDGFLYLQITRGVAPRGHAFPTHAKSSCVMTARLTRPLDINEISRGVAVITIPDIRWKRCDIKAISLLPNCLGKQRAHEAGAYEAWLVEAGGLITEGTSTNAWIVTAGGELVTRDTGAAILNGITRQAVMKLAGEEGIALVERPFGVDEAKAASEAFLTSTTAFIRPVIRIDGVAIGGGGIGPICGRLIACYADYLFGQGAGP